MCHLSVVNGCLCWHFDDVYPLWGKLLSDESDASSSFSHRHVYLCVVESERCANSIQNNRSSHMVAILYTDDFPCLTRYTVDGSKMQWSAQGVKHCRKNARKFNFADSVLRGTVSRMSSLLYFENIEARRIVRVFENSQNTRIWDQSACSYASSIWKKWVTL